MFIEDKCLNKGVYLIWLTYNKVTPTSTVTSTNLNISIPCDDDDDDIGWRRATFPPNLNLDLDIGCTKYCTWGAILWHLAGQHVFDVERTTHHVMRTTCYSLYSLCSCLIYENTTRQRHLRWWVLWQYRLRSKTFKPQPQNLNRNTISLDMKLEKCAQCVLVWAWSLVVGNTLEFWMMITSLWKACCQGYGPKVDLPKFVVSS